MAKNDDFGKNRKKCAKNLSKLEGQYHFMGKYHIQELFTWNIVCVVYFQDQVKKFCLHDVYSVFGQFLGTP